MADILLEQISGASGVAYVYNHKVNHNQLQQVKKYEISDDTLKTFSYVTGSELICKIGGEKIIRFSTWGSREKVVSRGFLK